MSNIGGVGMAVLCYAQGKEMIFPKFVACQKKLPLAVSLWVKERTPVLCFVKRTNSKFLKGNKNLYFSEPGQLAIPMQEDESSGA